MTVGWDPKPVPDLAGGPLRSTCRFPRDLHYYYIYKKKKKKKEVGWDQLEKASATLGTSAPIKILKILKVFARFHFREFSEILVMLWRSLFHWNFEALSCFSFSISEPHSLIATTTTIHKFCT